MLFIFRQLRRLELHKRSGRYFLYAFGEIVLIVVGILIALQINNWNEKRLERVEEKLVLEQILNEIKETTRVMPGPLQQMEEKAAALEYVALAFKTQTVDDPFAFLQKVEVGDMSGWGIRRMTRTTFDESVSSGKFSLIQNALLRGNINRFYHRVANDEDQAELRIGRYAQIVYDLIPRDEEDRDILLGLEESEYAAIAAKVLASSLDQEITRERNRTNYIKRIWNSRLKDAEALMAEIEAELNQ